ncbi:hypothetical protein [Nocardioides agariphilus]
MADRDEERVAELLSGYRARP